MALLVGAANAAAQGDEAPTPPRPAPTQRPIVLDPTRANGPGSLFATVSLFEAIDDPVLGTRFIDAEAPNSANTAGTAALPGTGSGFSSGGHAGLSFVKPSLTVSGRTSVSYVPSLDRYLTTAGVSGSGSKKLTSRTTVHASPYASFSNFYGVGLFPMLEAEPGSAGQLAGAPPGLDSAVAPLNTYRYGIGANLDQALAEHTSVGADYMLVRTDVRDHRYRLFDQRIGGYFSQAVSAHLSLRLGYGYREADYAGRATPVRGHDIDAGVDYHRQLSFSRGTKVSFSTGSGMMTRDITGPATSPRQTDFRLLGSADVDQELGRTWSARFAYRRNWQFVEGFAEPFFDDALTLGVGGHVNRQTTLGASASALYGSVGLDTESNRHHSYGAAVVMRTAFTRTLSAYAQYQYYRYDFANTIVLPIGFPREFERNGARVGLTWLIPLMR
jgi:hypothetical protein